MLLNEILLMLIVYREIYSDFIKWRSGDILIFYESEREFK